MDHKSELYYILSLDALKELVGLGLLTPEEFKLAESYIAEKYHPLLYSH